MLSRASWLLVGVAGMGSGNAWGQAWTQPRVSGTVPVVEASVTGALMVSGSKTVLGGASVVTAKDRPAHVTLERGGSVTVCQTSVLHLTESQMGPADALVRDWSPKVLLALERGAMEVRMPLLPGDALLTADLRFSSTTEKGKAEPLDVAMLVSPNGDTCVENRGKKAPTLHVSHSFAGASYELKPGQHVMFERGSLQLVNDRETTPCGCPPVGREEIAMAPAAVRKGDTKPVTAKEAAKQHPFPADVSVGLKQPGPVPPTNMGTQVQVGTTLAYDAEADKKATPAATGSVPPEVTLATAPQLAPPPAKAKAKNEEGHGFFHAIGHFFKHLFAR